MNKKFLVILLLSLFLLSGCVQVDFYQKIKRSGNVDFSITLTGDSSILSYLINSIDINESEDVAVSKTDNSITYLIKDFNPRSSSVFNTEEGSESDITVLESDNYRFERKFKFPYYYFVYEIKSDAKEDDSDSIFDVDDLLKMTFTIEVFGRITDTNGEKLDSKTVQFDLINHDGPIYVEFRDLFFVSWIGHVFS